MRVVVRATAANATTTPTFQADTTAAKTLFKGAGSPLARNDIPGSGYWMELVYDSLFNSSAGGWCLENPATGPVASVIAGEVRLFAMTVVQAGWLKCNGQAVSRTTYAALFAAIGIAFGVGDGSTTFNVPDLRGQFVRGWDDAAGIDTGRVFGSLQQDQLQDHTHTTYANQQSIYQPGGSAGLQQLWPTPNSNSGGTSNPITGNHGSETRPKNVALMYCIKT
jgi:microcystin-dependent protein